MKKGNKKVYIIWGCIVTILLAGIITTAVVIEKNKNTNQNVNGSSPNQENSPTKPNTNSISNSNLPFIPMAPNPAASPSTPPLSSILKPSSSTTTAISSSSPTPSSSFLSCTNPRIRKSWRELSDVEKNTFFNAVQQLKKAPSQMGLAGRYDDFVLLHEQVQNTAHKHVRNFIIFFFLKKNNSLDFSPPSYRGIVILSLYLKMNFVILIQVSQFLTGIGH
jgi:hypothetical protein